MKEQENKERALPAAEEHPEKEEPKIIRQLEEGGCSSVFLIQGTSGTQAVLKIITNDRLAKEWHHEASALEKLGLLIDSGVRPGTGKPFFIMPFITGSTLNWHLAEHKDYDLSKRVYFMLRMTDKLLEVHENNIIHGDVSPANFMYDSDTDELSIIDFNWSKIVEGKFSEGCKTIYWGWRWFNTPENEHFKGIPGGEVILKPSADVYQLAGTFRYLLGQEDPVRFQAQPNVLHDQDIEELIEKMSCENPNDRISLQEVKSYLLRISKKISPSAPRLSI